MKKSVCFILFILVFFGTFSVFLQTHATEKKVCRDITSSCKITVNSEPLSSDLTDGDEETYLSYDYAKIVVESPEPIGGIYIKFDRTPPQWSLFYGGLTLTCGKYGFLHEYQELIVCNVTNLKMIFPIDTSFADIYVLSRGDKLPDFVQKWRPAEGECDIMLLSCHSDDDQIFFAGSVPDAVNRGAEMQVCYFTNHWKSHRRPHELLNGLWTCGLDRYPVIGRYPDIRREDSETEMLEVLSEYGYTYVQMIEDQVELLRKYKPQIVLVHDIYGEYGHGAHKLDSHSLRDASMFSNNPIIFPESAEKYGVWDVPKIYIHLYSQNKIDFEIDKPLKRFGGKTAYQVSQQAFLCHKSQLNSRFQRWLFGTEEKPAKDSHDFPDYSPRYYGLWKTSVGKDVVKTDFYENIVLLKDREPEQTVPEETTAEITTAEETTAFETTVEETTLEETTVEETAVETETEITEETAAEEPTDETTEEDAITQNEPETAAEVTGDNDTVIQNTPENKTDPVPLIVVSVCCLAVAVAVFAFAKKKSNK